MRNRGQEAPKTVMGGEGDDFRDCILFRIFLSQIYLKGIRFREVKMEEKIIKGTIAGISGDALSKLWTLHFEDGSSAQIGSGYGVRQLAVCYGATEGTGDLIEKIKGKKIFYSVNGMGVMEGFSPIEEASEELLEAIQAGRAAATQIIRERMVMVKEF